MDILYKIGAFLGFLAFIQAGSLSSKMNRFIREIRGLEDKAYRGNNHIGRDILEPYIGSQIRLSFFEDEEDEDIFEENNVLLVAVDEKWALLELTDHEKKRQKLIRLSSLKGISSKK